MRRLVVATLVLALTGASAASATPGEISTVAGGGMDDGIAARAAGLFSPSDVAIGPGGIVAIADAGTNRVRGVLPDGTITTLAGMGSYKGPNGDGGPATQARVGSAVICYGPDGSLYVYSYGRVRRVDPHGIISTVVGGGTRRIADGARADEVNLFIYGVGGIHVAADGALFLSDARRVWKVSTDGVVHLYAGRAYLGFYGDGGPATDAELTWPSELVTDDAGNLYIADYGNARVRIVDPGGTIRTFAGGGHPKDGNGDDGPAAQARLAGPVDLALDAGGTLLMVDDYMIRSVAPSGIIRTIAGKGLVEGLGLEIKDGLPANVQPLNNPSGIAVDAAGNIYVGSSYDHSFGGDSRVRRIDTAGTMWFFAGNGAHGPNVESAPATQSVLSGARDVAAAPDGSFYVVQNRTVSRVATDGSMTTVANDAWGPYQHYAGIAVAEDGAVFYADSDSLFGDPTTIWMQDVRGNRVVIASDQDGIEAVHDVAVTPDGSIVVTARSGLYSLSRPILPLGGKVAKVDPEVEQIITSDRIWRECPSAGTPEADTDPQTPYGLAISADGPIFFTSCDRIMRLNADGSATRIAGTGEHGFSGDDGPALEARFNNPRGMSFDGAGNLLVSDAGNHRIRRIDPTGIITTVAGGAPGFAGDGGTASDASFVGPSDVSVAPDGAMLIADSGNDRIRRIAAT